jgi:hypothetical protein
MVGGLVGVIVPDEAAGLRVIGIRPVSYAPWSGQRPGDLLMEGGLVSVFG